MLSGEWAAFGGDPTPGTPFGLNWAGRASFLSRRCVLDAQAARDGTLVTETHTEPIRASVVHALGAPAEGFWRIDARPLSLTELHAHRQDADCSGSASR